MLSILFDCNLFIKQTCHHKETRTGKGVEGCRGAVDRRADLTWLLEKSLQINKLLPNFLSKLKEENISQIQSGATA